MSLERRFSVNGTGKEDASLQERHLKADQALARKYDQLAEKLAAVEKYLRSLHLPQPIYVSYNESELDPMIHGRVPYNWDCLAFRRHQGKWRLCHAKCNSAQCEDGTEPSWKPLV